VLASKGEESVNDFLFIFEKLITALSGRRSDGVSPEAQSIAKGGLVLSASQNQGILWMFNH
jgi:hypothetical protein